MNPSIAGEIAPSEHYAAAYFSECFIDELARAAWRDPVQYRRELLPGSSRLRRVLDEAARISGWSRPLPAGHARGIALSAAQGAVAAHVAEMSFDDHGASRVHRIVAVIDCGVTALAETARQRLQDSLRARWSSADRRRSSMCACWPATGRQATPTRPRPGWRPRWPTPWRCSRAAWVAKGCRHEARPRLFIRHDDGLGAAAARAAAG